MGIEEHKRDLRELLDAAVRIRLRADVPVGAFLSGGIDSSAVAGIAAKYVSRLKTFSVVFPGNGVFNESAIARNTSEFLGIEHYEVIADSPTLLESLEKSIWHAEYPQMNLHGVAKMLVAQLAREHVKVVLTGEGSDELLLGYTWLNDAPKTQHRTNGRIRRLCNRVEYQIYNGNRIIAQLFHRRHRKCVLKADLLETGFDSSKLIGLDPIYKRQYITAKTLLGRYILPINNDQPAMSAQIESRYPFLDHHFAERTFTIPNELKSHAGTEKYILREAVRDIVTDEVYKGKKVSFMAPPVSLTRGSCPKTKELLDQYLCRSAIENAGVFDWTSVKMLEAIAWKGPKRWRAHASTRLMFILSTQILHQQFIANSDTRSELASTQEVVPENIRT